MDGIFISYRREDSSGYAGRLYDRLAARFGRERVFMDVEGIDPGTDFIDAIDSAVASCTVLLVLIGPKWLGEDIGSDKRRIDDPHDFVRLETAAALRRKIRVLPVLVNDAEMPGEDALPPDLKALARRQAIEINHKQWDASTGEVLKALDRIFGTDKPRWRLPAIIGATCVALAAGGWLSWHELTIDDATRPATSVGEPGDAVTDHPTPTLLAAAEPPAPAPPAAATDGATPSTPAEAAGANPPAEAPTKQAVTAPPAAAPPAAPAAPAAPTPAAKPRETTTPPPQPAPKPAQTAKPAATAPPQPERTAPEAVIVTRPEAAPKTAPVRPRPAPAAVDSRLPRAGESWVYRTRGLWATSPKRTVVVTVSAQDGTAVTERMQDTEPAPGPAGTQVRWRGSEARIAHDGGLGTEFSPFISAFAELQQDTSWRGIPTPDLDGNWGGWYGTGEVIGRETVRVPAGSFDAWKVEVWSTRHATGGQTIAGLEPVRIHFLIWYAPGEKRYVKMQRTLISALSRDLEKDTIELVSSAP
ncbi:toll/interleukin-1 receptor domain-containing protein [Parazoarcus communis]|uniref:toll/interleukin-1 receptor domain-containing protein n=1 Tax=Parazoarcus communis TaxID=41977 RepID=UPI0019023A4C|nr:toll/interleukin-1 receptor domain-containing protein [Parazoarcus communis]